MENKEKDINALNTHFKLLQEIAERIRVQLQGAFNISFQPIIEAQGHFEEIRRLYSNYLDKQAVEFQRSFEALISPAFEELQRSFSEVPPRTQEALLLLGNHGLYLDLEMTLPDLLKIEKALLEGKVEEADHALIEYFEARIDEIQESISKRFPNREKLIRAAFNAHRREEYELTIPILLAQADGICKEVLKEYLFMKQNKKPRTAIYVEQIASDTLKAAILSPLSQTLPIGASEHERAGAFNELNRHMVMHGESLDYGTKTNSLKAISLINYVAHVLNSENENH